MSPASTAVWAWRQTRVKRSMACEDHGCVCFAFVLHACGWLKLHGTPMGYSDLCQQHTAHDLCTHSLTHRADFMYDAYYYYVYFHTQTAVGAGGIRSQQIMVVMITGKNLNTPDWSPMLVKKNASTSGIFRLCGLDILPFLDMVCIFSFHVLTSCIRAQTLLHKQPRRANI